MRISVSVKKLRKSKHARRRKERLDVCGDGQSNGFACREQHQPGQQWKKRRYRRNSATVRIQPPTLLRFDVIAWGRTTPNRDVRAKWSRSKCSYQEELGSGCG